MPLPATPQDGAVVNVAFEVHDAARLHDLARRLWIASNGSDDGVDDAMGPSGAPKLDACIREAIDSSAIGITFSFA